MRTYFCSFVVALTVFCFGSPVLAEDRPDWGYTWIDPHYVPSNAPDELKDFHDVFIPMLEARGSAESAYLRENADALYKAAKQVPGTAGAEDHNVRKHYNRAARDMVGHCARLREIAHGGRSSEVYSTMKKVENDFVRLCNLCE